MQDNSVHMPLLQNCAPICLLLQQTPTRLIWQHESFPRGLPREVPLRELLSLARMQQLLSTRTIRIRRVHTTSYTDLLPLTLSPPPPPLSLFLSLCAWGKRKQTAAKLLAGSQPGCLAAAAQHYEFADNDEEEWRQEMEKEDALAWLHAVSTSCLRAVWQSGNWEQFLFMLLLLVLGWHNVGAILLFALPLVIKWHPACCFLWRQRQWWWWWRSWWCRCWRSANDNGSCGLNNLQSIFCI